MDEIKLKTINDIKIKPIPKILMGNGDNRKVKGETYFSEPYNNIFIVAKKKSGKTTVIFEIIRKCASKNTNVIIFASTVNKDKSYKAIKTYCKLKGIPCIGYTSFTEDDILKNIMDNLKEEPNEEEEDEKEEVNNKTKFNMYGGQQDEEERKPRKEKYLAPEFIFIFDDLSSEMRHKDIAKLLKTNRHYKAKVILSSQYLKDLQPDSLKQIDNWLVFGGQSEEKLRLIHQYADLAIEYPLFEDIYKNATQDKYNFLNINTANDELRKNFNKQYNL